MIEMPFSDIALLGAHPKLARCPSCMYVSSINKSVCDHGAPVCPRASIKYKVKQFF